MDSPCTLIQNFPGLSSSIHALLHDLSHIVCPLLGVVLAALFVLHRWPFPWGLR